MEQTHVFKYQCKGSNIDDCPDVNIRFELDGNETSLTGMLSGFEDYLHACGFYFDGHLELIDDSSVPEQFEVEEEGPEVVENFQKSSFPIKAFNSND